MRYSASPCPATRGFACCPEVAVPPTAKGLRWLLGLFQDAGWPREIAFIDRDPRAIKRAPNAVTRLDRKLARQRPRLRLCWNGSGNGICCYLIV